MLHPILGRIPTNFFSEAVGEPPQAATGEAPTDEQAEPPVQPPAADHGADSAHVRRSANKALPRGDVGDQAQLHVPHACARKPAKPPPPRAEVFAIEAEVARGLARLTALSGMAPSRSQFGLTDDCAEHALLRAQAPVSGRQRPFDHPILLSRGFCSDSFCPFGDLQCLMRPPKRLNFSIPTETAAPLSCAQLADLPVCTHAAPSKLMPQVPVQDLLRESCPSQRKRQKRRPLQATACLQG